MGIDMLLFDYREPEKKYFENYDSGCFSIKFFEESLNEEFLQKIETEVLENITVLSVFIHSTLNENVLKHFKNLRLISARSTGVDHIDLEYCRHKNIAVVNVENYGSTTVAQYTFALILALVRKIVPAYNFMCERRHDYVDFLGRNLETLTLGVIGTGSIGGSVCRFANSFGMNILAHDLHPKQEVLMQCGVKYTDMEEIFEKADIITLHTPYTPQTHHLLSKVQFDKMKKSPFIINTSRGELINLFDLKTALELKLINGAALDVLTCESLTFRCDEHCPIPQMMAAECVEELKIVKEIIEYPNVIITPHIAYETQEAVDKILETSMCAIRDFFKGVGVDRVV